MEPMEHANIRPRGRPRAFATEVTAEMVRRYNAGESMRELAERYGVNVTTISRTLHKHNEKAPAGDQPGTGREQTTHDTPGGGVA